MIKNIKKLIIPGVTFLLMFPLVALADIDFTTLPEGGLSFAGIMNNALNFIWPLFEFLAIILFVYAGILFLSANGDAAKISTAKKALLWGIIGVAVGILAFSIPTIVRTQLGA